MTFHGTIGFGSDNVFSWCRGPPDNPRCLSDFLGTAATLGQVFFLSHFGNLILKVKLQFAITQTPRWLSLSTQAHTVKQHLEYDACDVIRCIDFALNCGQVEADIRK